MTEQTVGGVSQNEQGITGVRGAELQGLRQSGDGQISRPAFHQNRGDFHCAVAVAVGFDHRHDGDGGTGHFPDQGHVFRDPAEVHLYIGISKYLFCLHHLYSSSKILSTAATWVRIPVRMHASSGLNRSLWMG